MNQIIQFRGVIIKESQVGESDKYLTLLTKDRGKVTVRARGAKNAKSKFLTAQMFSYADFIVFQGGVKASGFLSLTQVELIESFYDLRLDYDRLMVAYDLAKIIDRYLVGTLEDTIEPHESAAILWLVLKSLKTLAKGVIDSALVHPIFCLKFLQIVGLSPYVEKNVVYTAHDSIPVKENVGYTLSYILEKPVKDVYAFHVTADILSPLSELCQVLLRSLEI